MLKTFLIYIFLISNLLASVETSPLYEALSRAKQDVGFLRVVLNYERSAKKENTQVSAKGSIEGEFNMSGEGPFWIKANPSVGLAKDPVLRVSQETYFSSYDGTSGFYLLYSYFRDGKESKTNQGTIFESKPPLRWSDEALLGHISDIRKISVFNRTLKEIMTAPSFVVNLKTISPNRVEVLVYPEYSPHISERVVIDLDNLGIIEREVLSKGKEGSLRHRDLWTFSNHRTFGNSKIGVPLKISYLSEDDEGFTEKVQYEVVQCDLIEAISKDKLKPTFPKGFSVSDERLGIIFVVGDNPSEVIQKIEKQIKKIE